MLKKILIICYADIVIPLMSGIVLPFILMYAEREFRNTLMSNYVLIGIIACGIIFGALMAVACFCFTRKKEDLVFNVIVLSIGILYSVVWYLKPFTGILFPYGMYYVSISMGAYISLIIYSVACVLKK